LITEHAEAVLQICSRDRFVLDHEDSRRRIRRRSNSECGSRVHAWETLEKSMRNSVPVPFLQDSSPRIWVERMRTRRRPSDVALEKLKFFGSPIPSSRTIKA